MEERLVFLNAEALPLQPADKTVWKEKRKRAPHVRPNTPPFLELQSIKYGLLRLATIRPQLLSLFTFPLQRLPRRRALGLGCGQPGLHAATDALEEWCLAHFTAPFAVFTTHDLYIAAFLAARNVISRFTEANWPRFLDSAAIILAPDGTRRYALVRAGLSDRVTGV